MAKASPLIKTTKLSERQLDLIVRQTPTLPVLREACRPLLELVVQADGQGQAAAEAQAKAIELAGLDVSLSCQLLRQANSGGKNTDSARTLAQAVEVLGFDALRSAVLLANLSSPGLPRGFDHLAYARHCLAVATAAREITKLANLPLDPSEVFQAGLLHDVGQLAIASALPKSYARVLSADRADGQPLAQREQQTIGVDHCVFGRRLAEHWRLGQLVESAAWLHHHEPQGLIDAADRDVLAAICLAESIACQAGLGFFGADIAMESIDLQARSLGLQPGQVASLRDELPAMVGAHIQQFAGQRGGGVDEAGNAAAQAGAELARLNQQLQGRLAALAGQAKAFVHLHDFIAGLCPESTTADTLQKIAATMAAALDIQVNASCPIIVYCIDPSEPACQSLALCFDGGESPSWLSLPAGARCASLQAHDLSALQVVNALSASAMEKWADLSTYLHHPLASGGRWIGGVLYPQYLLGVNACEKQALQAIEAALALALAIVQDRTKAIRLSEQLAGASQVLAQASQTLAAAKALSAVGEMAGGAAHEINNPLAIISGRAQIMQKKAAAADDRKAWQNVAQQAQRISDIISELMEFANPPSPKQADLDMRAVFANAARLVQEGQPANATQEPQPKVDIEIAENVPRVCADATHLQAVLAELIANAANAASRRIVLSARPSEDGNVLLSVKDDGSGMDAATAAKAFAPFFSAQQSGRRRGLGLPKAQRYIELNGGRIWITATGSSGTEMSILLPAAK